MSEIITVKVIRVPGSVQEVGLNSGVTVNDALSAAGVEVGAGETLSLGGNTVEPSASLSDGDRIIITKGAKGA